MGSSALKYAPHGSPARAASASATSEASPRSSSNSPSAPFS